MIKFIQYKQIDTHRLYRADAISLAYNNKRNIFSTYSFPFLTFGGLLFATSYRKFPNNRICLAFPEGSACVKKIFLAFSEGSKGFIKKYFSPSEGSGSSKKKYFNPSEGSGGFIEKKMKPSEGSACIKKCVWRHHEAFCK